MIKLKQILDQKTIPLTTVAPTDTVQHAVQLMHERNIGAVMALENNRLCGIFTERDCLHKVTASCRNPREVLVSEVMTKAVRFVTLDTGLSDALALMTEHFLRHLPVLDEQQNILGIVSIRDLVKAKLADQSFIIEQMERYIRS